MAYDKQARLDALDMARFLAFVGMVIVNFAIVTGASEETGSWASTIASALQGRAAAIFVVLAGLGLALADARAGTGVSVGQTIKRGLFLLVLGLLNMLIFEADIIHYYAFYFVFGMACLRLNTQSLCLVIAGLVFGFLALVLALDYNAGWDWSTLSYSGFWTLGGFIRNLLFNGWHPVVPWLGFFLFGVLLARIDLTSEKLQGRLMLAGGVILVVTQLLSGFLVGLFPHETFGELALLFGTSPVPPMPLYMIAGMATAALMIGLCLRLGTLMARVKMLSLLSLPGRQTLTLYFLHIYVGMAVLEAMGYLVGPDGNTGSSAFVSLMAALVFSLAVLLYAHIWVRFFKRGPIEALMRRLVG